MACRLANHSGITVFSLNGCSFGVKPFPKTEQRNNMNLRKRLSLYLNFLEQDKKDFTELKSYTSDVYIKNR